MSRSPRNWAAYFKRSDAKNLARRVKRGEKIKRKSPPVIGCLILPRVVGDPPIFSEADRKSKIRRYAEDRLRRPTKAEEELHRILNSLNNGILRGRFKREHVVSGKWIVDFFFPEIRLAIEVDGSVHDTKTQFTKDKQKDLDCASYDITVLRLRNWEVFGDRDRLIERLRASWRRAKHRNNKIIGQIRPRAE